MPDESVGAWRRGRWLGGEGEEMDACDVALVANTLNTGDKSLLSCYAGREDDILCPIATKNAFSPNEDEVRAYKLGRGKCSYNQIELLLLESNGKVSNLLGIAEAAEVAVGGDVDDSLLDSSLRYNLRFNDGRQIRLYLFLVYAVPHGLTYGKDQCPEYHWVPVTRHRCQRGCKGPVLRGLQRFGKLPKRIAVSPGPCDGGWKETSKLYVAIDEASNHVRQGCGTTHFRLLVAAYTDDQVLLGSAVSPSIKVVANNDVPGGSANFQIHCNISEVPMSTAAPRQPEPSFVQRSTKRGVQSGITSHKILQTGSGVQTAGGPSSHLPSSFVAAAQSDFTAASAKPLTEVRANASLDPVVFQIGDVIMESSDRPRLVLKEELDDTSPSSSPSSEDYSEFLSEGTSLSEEREETSSQSTRSIISLDEDKDPYCRKDHSLSTSCQRLFEAYAAKRGAVFQLESLAASLDTSKRRVYDIVNVLESIQVVRRRAKNEYVWVGHGRVAKTLAILKGRITSAATTGGRYVAGSATLRDPGDDKSLRALSEKFVQIFLVNESRPIAWEFALKNVLEVGNHQHNMHRRGRRLYDVANILTSIHLLEKRSQCTWSNATAKSYFRFRGSKGVKDHLIAVASCRACRFIPPWKTLRARISKTSKVLFNLNQPLSPAKRSREEENSPSPKGVQVARVRLSPPKVPPGTSSSVTFSEHHIGRLTTTSSSGKEERDLMDTASAELDSSKRTTSRKRLPLQAVDNLPRPSKVQKVNTFNRSVTGGIAEKPSEKQVSNCSNSIRPLPHLVQGTPQFSTGEFADQIRLYRSDRAERWPIDSVLTGEQNLTPVKGNLSECTPMSVRPGKPISSRQVMLAKVEEPMDWEADSLRMKAAVIDESSEKESGGKVQIARFESPVTPTYASTEKASGISRFGMFEGRSEERPKEGESRREQHLRNCFPEWHSPERSGGRHGNSPTAQDAAATSNYVMHSPATPSLSVLRPGFATVQNHNSSPESITPQSRPSGVYVHNKVLVDPLSCLPYLFTSDQLAQIQAQNPSFLSRYVECSRLLLELCHSQACPEKQQSAAAGNSQLFHPTPQSPQSGFCLVEALTQPKESLHAPSTTIGRPQSSHLQEEAVQGAGASTQAAIGFVPYVPPHRDTTCTVREVKDKGVMLSPRKPDKGDGACQSPLENAFDLALVHRMEATTVPGRVGFTPYLSPWRDATCSARRVEDVCSLSLQGVAVVPAKQMDSGGEGDMATAYLSPPS